MSPYSYINKMFRSDAARSGGVVRRSIQDVHRLASRSALIEEVKRKNFHLIEAGDQYIVICSSAKIQVHC